MENLKRAFIVNTCQPPAAIYGYSVNVKKAIKFKSEIINVLIDKKKWNLPHEGVDLVSTFNSPYLEIITNLYIMRKIGYLSIDRNRDGINFLHFADQMLNPILVDKFYSTSTIHDNPNLVFKTGLYYRNDFGGLIRREFFKRRFNQYLKFENLISVSDFVKDGLIEYGYEGSITKIYPPIPPYFHKLPISKDECRIKLGLPLDIKLILSVSTDVPRKNTILIRKLIKKLNKDFLVVRVGSALGKGITFNNLDNDQMNLLFNACDVLIHPSFAEGCSSVILEACATGLPVVASNIPPNAEIAKNYAILINPESLSELMCGIDEAISVSEKITRIELMEKNKFDFSVFEREINSFYSKIYC